MPLLLLLAAVPASASPAGPEIPHCKTLMSDLPAADRGAQPRDLDLRVRHSLEASGLGRRVRWTLILHNRTSSALALGFPTSQYANVVLRRRTKTVYSWSAHRAFFQVNTARVLAPGATYACSLGPDPLDLEPGRYELIANLASRLQVRTRRSLVIPRPMP